MAAERGPRLSVLPALGVVHRCRGELLQKLGRAAQGPLQARARLHKVAQCLLEGQDRPRREVRGLLREHAHLRRVALERLQLAAATPCPLSATTLSRVRSPTLR
jgi:hypothetical protein